MCVYVYIYIYIYIIYIIYREIYKVDPEVPHLGLAHLAAIVVGDRFPARVLADHGLAVAPPADHHL